MRALRAIGAACAAGGLVAVGVDRPGLGVFLVLLAFLLLTRGVEGVALVSVAVPTTAPTFVGSFVVYVGAE